MSKKLIAAIVMLTLGILFFGVSWRFTLQDLDSAKTEVSNALVALESSKTELLEAKDELLTTKAELQDTKNYLSAIEAESQATTGYLLTVEAELEDTKARLSAIQADALYLHNPTFTEVIRFLRQDKTDLNEYREDEYVCTHFAGDVNNNAESQGIRCAFVAISFPKSAHAIIAFETTDEGMVYFDPLTDERVRPITGKEYWQSIEPRPGYFYEKPSFDDTIVDIVVIW